MVLLIFLFYLNIFHFAYFRFFGVFLFQLFLKNSLNTIFFHCPLLKSSFLFSHFPFFGARGYFFIFLLDRPTAGPPKLSLFFPSPTAKFVPSSLFDGSFRGVAATVQGQGPPKVRVLGFSGSFCETPAPSSWHPRLRHADFSDHACGGPLPRPWPCAFQHKRVKGLTSDGSSFGDVASLCWSPPTTGLLCGRLLPSCTSSPFLVGAQHIFIGLVLHGFPPRFVGEIVL